MIRATQYTHNLIDCTDVSLVGGKAVNLGRLSRAGFPVPSGFAVDTRAYAVAQTHSFGTTLLPVMPTEVAEEIRLAYRDIGAQAVAVRSSATAEDMAAASMAGQCETFLNIEGEAELIEAVQRCWASLNAPRIRAYLGEHGIDPATVAMAVVVQQLVPAEVAGVLFTTSPHNGHREMLIEASWGLGESVVSGRVQPDVFRLARDTGKMVSSTIADKRIQLSAGAHEERPVAEQLRRQACLRSCDLQRLWELGTRVAEHFSVPQDIEWAIGADEVYVLQSRPITTSEDAEAYEELLRTTRHNLRDQLASQRGPWVVHNLAETLPHPTPLTWSVIKKFTSGSGAMGAMYRQVGFKPGPVVESDGFLELIGGHVYMDVSRAPDMFFADFPFAYDMEELRRRPGAAQAAPTLPRGSFWSRLQMAKKLSRVNSSVRELSVDVDEQLRKTTFPALRTYVASGRQCDLRKRSNDELVSLWKQHEQFVLEEFGPHSLLPSLICGIALDDLQSNIQEHFWEEDAPLVAQQLSAGGPPDQTLLANAQLHEVGNGQRPLETWLADHGHRGVGEFDLAEPRWREQPDRARELASLLAAGDEPLARHHDNCGKIGERFEQLRQELTGKDQQEFERRVNQARKYVAFREDAKDVLMLGYDLLRDVALEVGRRLEIGNDVFYLTREDLFDALRVGYAPIHLIKQRKSVHRAEGRLSLPQFIDASTIENLGSLPDAVPMTVGHQALAISSGDASGPARVLHSPHEMGVLTPGYILVCPSTDPSWTPLFVNAAGLVLECGGSLSHGAVVAREMGLPAVVLPDATRLIREGQMIRVDGRRGWIGVMESEQISEPTSLDPIEPNDTRISYELIPPPPGRIDRNAARLRNTLALVWIALLLGFFFLPEHWLRAPVISAMDLMLWPMVRSWGKPATVAIVAALVAVSTLLVQRLFTDNRRLREAKRRASRLQSQARRLPVDSPRRKALLRAAAPVSSQSLAAALVPIGILLGPLVLPFVWFQERIDPAVCNPPPGSPVQIVAMVDDEWAAPIELHVPESVIIDETTPPVRTLPSLKPVLEHLLSLIRKSDDRATQPWELAMVRNQSGDQLADDLQSYLDAGIPPQGITWMIRPPADLSGKLTVSASTAGHAPLAVHVVLGDQFPPVPSDARCADAGAPVKELRVAYPRKTTEQTFCQPFTFLSGENRSSVTARLATWDVGWLGLYLMVYLPVLFVARRLLRIA